MTSITLDLLRKRSEHNDMSLGDLDEISLHQEGLIRINLINRVCKNLRILLLQGNAIQRLENVSCLKRLEYLNVAINCVEHIENLSGLERLSKLDLSMNFICKLSSLQTLRSNKELRVLYLAGNPCCSYSQYRPYVISTLPFLKELDGLTISNIERKRALENYAEISGAINTEENIEIQKLNVQRMKWPLKLLLQLSDGENVTCVIPNTPESRTAKAILMAAKQTDATSGNETKCTSRKYFKDDGTPWNCNEPRINFELQDKEGTIILILHTQKYLLTSDIQIDIQPAYIRVTIRKKIFQIVLPNEVSPDMSTSTRSLTTGLLQIEMPKVFDPIDGVRPSFAKRDDNVVSIRSKNADKVFDKAVKSNREFQIPNDLPDLC